MDIEKFIKLRPYLYHLTDNRNIEHILKTRKLYSTEYLVKQSTIEGKTDFLSTKRDGHHEISIGEDVFRIRDQRPISLKVLGRSLTENWDTRKFILTLNQRVFMWPTIKRLNSHFGRYIAESPSIIRASTREVLEINGCVEFARLNTGATRCSHHYNGDAPTRGEGTFLLAEDIEYSHAEIAEVTFPVECILPKQIEIGDSPNGLWVKQ